MAGFDHEVAEFGNYCVTCGAIDPYLVLTPNPATSSTSKTQKRIKKLCDRDGQRCFYCHVPFIPSEVGVLVSTNGSGEATIDHFVARAKGGGNGSSNLKAACRRCNEAKRAYDVRLVHGVWVNVRTQELLGHPMSAQEAYACALIVPLDYDGPRFGVR